MYILTASKSRANRWYYMIIFYDILVFARDLSRADFGIVVLREMYKEY